MIDDDNTDNKFQNSKVKLLIADDTLIAREGWYKILETEENFEIIGEACNAPQTLAQVKKLAPDIVLMDLMWFGDETAGAAAIAQIKRESPHTKVIAITAYRHLITDARHAGAETALSKGFSKSELINLINDVHNLQPNSIKMVHNHQSSTQAIPRSSPDPGQLLAGVGIPLLGFTAVFGALMWGIYSLSIQKFLVAVISAIIVYFFAVIFAGRYIDIIGETTTYKLFVRIFKLFRIKFPNLTFHDGQ